MPPQTLCRPDPRYKPVAQKKRMTGLKRQEVVKEQVEELLKAGFIRGTTYATWLVNVVLVKKIKWKVVNMCGLH